MFYIEKDNKIVLADKNKQNLENTLLFKPELQGLEIKEVQEGYVIVDFELMTIEEAEERKAQQEQERFKENFIETSLGWYRKQPKGYANAPQSLDIILNMVNAVGSFTQDIANLMIFYETPDFSKPEDCTEEWLSQHQLHPAPCAKEEFLEFYIEFQTLWANSQYIS